MKTVKGMMAKMTAESLAKSIYDSPELQKAMDDGVLQRAMGVTRLISISGSKDDKRAQVMMLSGKRPKKRLAKKILKKELAKSQIVSSVRACAAFRALVRTRNRKARQAWNALSEEERQKRLNKERWGSMGGLALGGASILGALMPFTKPIEAKP